MFQKLVGIFQKGIAAIMGKPEMTGGSSTGESSSSIQQAKSRCKILRNSRYFYSLQKPEPRQSKRTTRRVLSPEQNKQRTLRRRKTLKRLNLAPPKKTKRKKTSKKKNHNTPSAQTINSFVAENSVQNLGTSSVSSIVAGNSAESQKCPEIANNNTVESNNVINENTSTTAAPEATQKSPSAEDVTVTDSNPAGRLAKIFSESVNLELKYRFNESVEQSCSSSSASSSSTRTFVFFAKKNAEDLPSCSSKDLKEDNQSERVIQNFSYSSSLENEKLELQPSPETKASKSNIDSIESDLLSASSACMNLHALEFFPVEYDEMNSN